MSEYSALHRKATYETSIATHPVKSVLTLQETSDVLQHIPDRYVLEVGYNPATLKIELQYDNYSQSYRVIMHNSVTSQSIQYMVPVHVVQQNQTRKNNSMASDALSSLTTIANQGMIATANQSYYNTVSNMDTTSTGVFDDIQVNNRSLTKFMNDVEQRLSMLGASTALNEEWSELKELRDAYITKENEIKEKLKTWDAINKD